MSEEKKRQWWQKKTNWGLILYITGQVMAVIPVTAPFSVPVLTVGTVLAGYGIASRVSSK